jgi:DNA (cytosine-5)-methyltransferase 1
VDLITAGYPCQPFSLAGARRGEDDPRHLWHDIRNRSNCA